MIISDRWLARICRNLVLLALVDMDAELGRMLTESAVVHELEVVQRLPANIGEFGFIDGPRNETAEPWQENVVRCPARLGLGTFQLILVRVACGWPTSA